VDITKKASQSGISPRFLVTNGRIGYSYDNAKECFQRIQDVGFDFSVDENYIGSGYNGIDVSVDQFHKIPSEYAGNTILAALEVFGPTIFVSIRTTDPSEKYRDYTNFNSVIRYLQNSGKVQGINKESKEIVFTEGSRVKVIRLNAGKFGFAKNQPDDFFSWRNFSLEELVHYKDLLEYHPFPLVFPYHKLYINPNGNTYPELGRFESFSGGNIYEIPVSKAIENIDNNPLVSLLMNSGLTGLLLVLNKQFEVPLDLFATGDLHIHDRYLSDLDLMEKAREVIRSSGLEQQIRTKTLPLLQRLRKLYESGVVKMQFETQVSK
ncbi:MAG: hypothetical protein Q8N99_07800, partial [Nanoarchaeota archaeon]|nr:hypothetical protein [Nanoarchaeota archaeon]